MPAIIHCRITSSLCLYVFSWLVLFSCSPTCHFTWRKSIVPVTERKHTHYRFYGYYHFTVQFCLLNVRYIGSLAIPRRRCQFVYVLARCMPYADVPSVALPAAAFVTFAKRPPATLPGTSSTILPCNDYLCAFGCCCVLLPAFTRVYRAGLFCCGFPCPYRFHKHSSRLLFCWPATAILYLRCAPAFYHARVAGCVYSGALYNRRAPADERSPPAVLPFYLRAGFACRHYHGLVHVLPFVPTDASREGGVCATLRLPPFHQFACLLPPAPPHATGFWVSSSFGAPRFRTVLRFYYLPVADATTFRITTYHRGRTHCLQFPAGAYLACVKTAAAVAY